MSLKVPRFTSRCTNPVECGSSTSFHDVAISLDNFVGPFIFCCSHEICKLSFPRDEKTILRLLFQLRVFSLLLISIDTCEKCIFLANVGSEAILVSVYKMKFYRRF